MYHFIRRFFVLVLVLAFGFSFLLSCLVHTGYSQSNSYFSSALNVIPYSISICSMGMCDGINEIDEFVHALSDIYQISAGGQIQSNVLMHYQPNGQFLFSGSNSSRQDRTNTTMVTSIQQDIPNSVLQTNPLLSFPVSGASVMVFPWEVIQAPRSSFPSFLTWVPGYDVPYLLSMLLDVLMPHEPLIESYSYYDDSYHNFLQDWSRWFDLPPIGHVRIE